MDQKEPKIIQSYETVEELELANNIANQLYRYDQIAKERIPTIRDLTHEHVKQFWNQGYLVIDRLLEEDEIQQSLEALMDILNGASQEAKIQFVRKRELLHTLEEIEYAARKISEYVDHVPRLKAIASHPDMLSMLEKLFHEKPKLVQDQAHLKPPCGGVEKPWHQDMAYGPLAFDKSVIGCWIALDPAELDNGCMHVIPYSHREGGSPHFAVRDWQLCDLSVAVDRDVAVPLQPGGVLVFSGLLHHGTPPNFSIKRRRALQFHFAPESARKLTPQEYKRMFTNEMTGAEC